MQTDHFDKMKMEKNMTYDELSSRFDGIIPYHARMAQHYGSLQTYAAAFSQIAEKNFAHRCLRIVRSIAAWRETPRYEAAVREMMADRLQGVLKNARHSAIASLSLCNKDLSSDLSNVAVTAAPISTA